MIDFKVLPEALLFIAGAVPNTLFMAFVSIFFGILFGSFIAVLRLGNNMIDFIHTNRACISLV